MTLTWRSNTLELATPFRISRGTMTARTAVTVTLADHETGTSGRGEVVTSRYADLNEVRIDRELRTVRDRLRRGGDVDSTELTGVHPGVAAAVSSAAIDRRARAENRSVAASLGLDLPSAVSISRTIGIGTRSDMSAAAAQASGSGFRTLKVKTDHDVAESIRRVVAVAAAAPAADLIIDPNESWTVATATSVLAEIEDISVAALEQPLPSGDREGTRELRRRTDIPIIADESVHDVGHLDALTGTADAVNIKLAQCGGVHRAHRLAVAARDRGLDVMLGCLASSSLCIAPAVHLASLARWCDLDGHLLLARDPWTGLGGEDGVLRPNGRPGLGVEERENEARR